MLMVVFGAGASFDSVPSKPIRAEDINRPPLANQLFDTRPSFKSAMARFEKCLPVIPYLQEQHASVERVLERLQEEAKDYPERDRQLAAIRWYLHYALWELERRWLGVSQGVTNYKTLLDQIQRWRKPGQQVCLATFNYDTMLEAALPTVGINIENLNSYIRSEYKIIKIHGSINWAREVHNPPFQIDSLNVWDVAYALISHAPDIDISKNYRIVGEYPIGKLDGTALFPALAIPVETKRSFECPEPHMDVLRQCIKQATKLLIIGWRGMEDHFLRLLAENLVSGISIMAINGRADEAKQTLHRIGKAGVKFDAVPSTPMKVGFSDFIVQRIGDDFLKS
ncbi:MAG: hypothetical protein WCA59_03105 [Candidatus Binataceae bacterium]